MGYPSSIILGSQTNEGRQNWNRRKIARKTLGLNTNVRFIKVVVENLDRSKAASDIKVGTSLSG
jgi:hypothetical protein